MLKFWFSKYSLQPMTQIGSLAQAHTRDGALFKIQWPDQKIGYADLFPWPELGDETLEAQLENLRQGRISPLVEQTIWFATRDSAARSARRNIFQGLARVKNHFLVNDPSRIEDLTIDEAKSAGFTTIKVKVGRKPDEELRWIDRIIRQHQQMLLRLDFNSSFSLPEFKDFMGALHPAIRAKIEFVEDPFPYDPDKWKAAAEFATLALDHQAETFDWKKAPSSVPFKVLIIKPARQDLKNSMANAARLGLKMVVTSSLDHPVGIAHAAFVAGELKKFHPNTLLDCGCLSLRAYKPNDFSSSMILQGPYLLDIPGFGIGFDYQLERLQWNPLKAKP